MLKLSHGHPVSSALDWRRIYNDLLRWARGINEIDRDSLKIGSVNRIDLAVNTTLFAAGEREEDFQTFYKGSIVEGHGSDWDKYSIKRKRMFLDVIETGTYMFSWWISGRRSASTFDEQILDQFPRVKLFVDSRELTTGHCIDYAMFEPQKYIDLTLGSGANVPITFSGTAFANLLQGKHLIDLDFITPFDYTFEMINISIIHFGW